MKKKKNVSSENVENLGEENVLPDEEKKPKTKFYTELWFILTLCGVAFVALFIIILSVARGGGLSWKNLFGKSDPDLDYVNDSLDAYIDIKESDYKNYEIKIPMLRPTDVDLNSEINKLLATYRNPESNGTYIDAPIKIGDDVNISYLGYKIDASGRKILLSGATNYPTANTKTDKYTVGLNSAVFGIGFEEGLVGKKPNGKLDSVRDWGSVLNGNVIYATVSFVLDNGLVYDEVDVVIDPTDENFDKCWGIGAYENLFRKCNTLGLIMLPGNAYNTFALEGGGQITYTGVTVNYVTESSEEPITVESRFPFDYSIEDLRNEKVYYDVYIESVEEHDTPEFNEAFIKEKLKLDETALASYSGANLVEKCREYYREKLNNTYEAVCRSYAERKVWERLNSEIKIKMYPQNEVDRIYIALVEGYMEDLARANAAGANYSEFDDYMVEVLELGEGAEWTGYLLEQVKSQVKERLITYAVLRKEGILPVGSDFDKIYEAELKKDFEYANNASPGTFSSLEDYRQYIIEERTEAEYKHTVYYYYATDKLVEMATIVYPS
ncbi:MAG: hypothetical protein E7673_01840 [Ruminococcaceae bacterium]|nr:hypothetical protein [Oscillospiraceae bacterium]